MGGLQVFDLTVFLCFIQKLDTYNHAQNIHVKYEFPDFPSLSAFLLSLPPPTKALWTPQAEALPLSFSGQVAARYEFPVVAVTNHHKPIEASNNTHLLS